MLWLANRWICYPGNEEMVGKAIRDSGIPRSSIYITTKLSLVAYPSRRSMLTRTIEWTQEAKLGRHLNNLWEIWIVNTLTFTSSIGRKLDHTVCLFTRVGERPSHLCFENLAEDGKIRGPSEGYPELINVWKEMEKLLDTGMCFVCILGTYDITRALFNWFTR
jgi:hypothetical protein